MNIEKMRSYWNNDGKIFYFFEFVDNLELDDKKSIIRLKTIKEKIKDSNSININEIIKEDAKELKKFLDEYFKQKKNKEYKKKISLIKNILIILLIIFIIIGSIIYI